MTPTEWTYLIFGIVLILAIIFDLGLLSRKGYAITIKQAILQTLFWVTLGTGFGFFVWFEDGQTNAIEYFSAYFMEKGLSIDNIFVFILIFSYFKVPEKFINWVLMLGILLAIVLRIIFITVGIALIQKFHWILYIFGAFLVYTGIRMFIIKSDHEFDPRGNRIYKILQKIFRLTDDSSSGQFIVIKDGKRYYTILFVVFIMLAFTDLIFALDSIPAVFAITQKGMLVYTSNIFAVLGLRSLFFALRGAVHKFRYLKEGIAVILIFIGLKMLVDYFGFHLHVVVSLIVIVSCFTGSILLSIHKNIQESKKQKELN